MRTRIRTSEAQANHEFASFHLGILMFLAMLLCSCCPERQQDVFSAVTQSQQSAGNFSLYVTNQSGHVSPVDMRFYVDDLLLTTADVPSGPNRQHGSVWEVQPGLRKIRVTVSSIPGLTIEKDIDVATGKHVYLSVSFYFNFPLNSDQKIEWPSLKMAEYDR